MSIKGFLFMVAAVTLAIVLVVPRVAGLMTPTATA